MAIHVDQDRLEVLSFSELYFMHKFSVEQAELNDDNLYEEIAGAIVGEMGLRIATVFQPDLHPGE